MYQKWSRFHNNYQNIRISVFWLLVSSTKIDSACVRMFRPVSGLNAAGYRRANGGAAVSNTEWSWYQESSLLLYFTIRPHLDKANNQKPKYGWYKSSNLEGWKMSDFYRFSLIQQRNRCLNKGTCGGVGVHGHLTRVMDIDMGKLKLKWAQSWRVFQIQFVFLSLLSHLLHSLLFAYVWNCDSFSRSL